MKYTFNPKEPNAKAYGSNLDISTKDAQKLCRVINRKRLETAKKILSDLIHEKRSLDGKYYTKAAKRLLLLLGSAEKNAEFSGLETEKLRVHAAACRGLIQYRSRRKSDFGRRMKLTNVEIILIEDASIEKVSKKQKAKKKEEKTKEEPKKKAEEKKEKGEAGKTEAKEEKTGEDKKEQAEKEKPAEKEEKDKEEKTEQVKPELAEQKKEVEQKKEEHADKPEDGKKEEQNKEPREKEEKGDNA